MTTLYYLDHEKIYKSGGRHAIHIRGGENHFSKND
jgi:hypothetical protein